MAKWQYTKGLHDIGNGCWAYLQPDGSWGWSNAGLVTDGEATLLVDTLFDLRLTAEMLGTMRRSVPQAKHIGTLVNTHANGDHTFGNELVQGARIIASQGTVDEFDHVTPAAFKAIMDNVGQFGKAGEFVLECFRPFDFSGITLTPPHEVFSGRHQITVGGKTVELIEVGPAHTKGDTLVYLPAEKILYTGDIVFNEGTPISWAGPMSNWVKACDLILGLDVDVVAPGHGGITDKSGVRAMKGYLDYVTEEARKRYDRGMSPLETAFDIDVGKYVSWGDAERLVVSVHALRRIRRRAGGARTDPVLRAHEGPEGEARQGMHSWHMRPRSPRLTRSALLQPPASRQTAVSRRWSPPAVPARLALTKPTLSPMTVFGPIGRGRWVDDVHG